jgi:uncharacterized Zn-binding protein involved in type VI secretion
VTYARVIRAGLLAVLLGMVALVGSPVAAGAAVSQPNIEDFILPDGTFDETGYIAALGATEVRADVVTQVPVAEVPAPPAAVTRDTLPRTGGSNVGYAIALAIGLVVVGGAIVAGTRARTRPAS